MDSNFINQSIQKLVSDAELEKAWIHWWQPNGDKREIIYKALVQALVHVKAKYLVDHTARLILQKLQLVAGPHVTFKGLNYLYWADKKSFYIPSLNSPEETSRCLIFPTSGTSPIRTAETI